MDSQKIKKPKKRTRILGLTQMPIGTTMPDSSLPDAREEAFVFPHRHAAEAHTFMHRVFTDVS
jgi:hypothetical protein